MESAQRDAGIFYVFEVCLHLELVYNIYSELYEILCSELVFERGSINSVGAENLHTKTD
jgi:hypothetical protein